MSKLPVLARAYIVFIAAAALALAGISALALFESPSSFISVLLLAGLIALLDNFPVVMRKDQVEFTISTAIEISAVMLAPGPIVVLGILLGTALAELRMPRAIYKKTFNVTSVSLHFGLLAWIYSQVHAGSLGLVATSQDLMALAVLGLANFALESLLLPLALALSTHANLIYIWSESFKPVIWHNLSMVPLGAFVAMLWNLSPLAVLFAAIPLLLVRYSEGMVFELRRQTLDALMALARILDERDEDTYRHCELVSNHAADIARTMGLPQEEIDIITRAAYLHDIGKIGMPNQILFKPGALSPSENERAKEHSIVGGELLRRFPLFERGALYVRHHHERWDGRGYPDMLSGTAIPLGARILAVADSFQAMTEDRPYRAALSLETAMEQLALNAGTQFDPDVVRALFRVQGLQFPESVARPEPKRIEPAVVKA